MGQTDPTFTGRNQNRKKSSLTRPTERELRRSFREETKTTNVSLKSNQSTYNLRPRKLTAPEFDVDALSISTDSTGPDVFFLDHTDRAPGPTNSSDEPPDLPVRNQRSTSVIKISRSSKPGRN